MPTYEYVCRNCGHDLEVVQSIHDPSLTECPECGGALRKLFGNVGVHFKGSGFYRTDSRSGSGKGGATKDKAAAAGSDSGAPSSGAKDSSAKKSEPTTGKSASSGTSAGTSSGSGSAAKPGTS